MNDKIVARCIKCNSQFTEQDIKDAICCPNCKTKSIPMSPENDLDIKINLQELRILTIWAENYATKVDNEHLDDAYHEPLKDTVKSIVDRLHKQLEKLNNDISLTLTEEFQEIEKLFPDAKIYRDGIEEV